LPADRQAEQVFRTALARFDADDLAGAAAGFEQVLQLDANHALAHYQLGNVRRDQGRYADAERHFRLALALSPAHAETHNNLGVIQQVTGRLDEAVASYRRAVQAKPTLTQAYLNLGRLLMQQGRRDEAAQCYRDAAASSDKPGVFTHLLAALEGRSTAAAPDDYVRATFDGFARQFDQQLVGELGYHVPEAMARAVARVRPFAPASADVLDLGCGTGLSGAALAPLARKLVGIDLSANMLHEARARGCYHQLAQAEILGWMRGEQAAQFDLIVAADVFTYIGDLGPAFAEAARLARTNALFTFSLEVCSAVDWRLQDSGRYAQSAAFIERLAKEHHFSVALRADQPLRKPIVGLLYVLTRAA
jgi:predicted TPR repeat methyltransferase